MQQLASAWPTFEPDMPGMLLVTAPKAESMRASTCLSASSRLSSASDDSSTEGCAASDAACVGNAENAAVLMLLAALAVSAGLRQQSRWCHVMDWTNHRQAVKLAKEDFDSLITDALASRATCFMIGMERGLLLDGVVMLQAIIIHTADTLHIAIVNAMFAYLACITTIAT